MASIFESASFPFLIETTSHCIALSRPVLSLWWRSLTTPDGRRRWRRCINASQVTRVNQNPASLYYHYEIKLSRARIAPVAQGKWIGNFDILRTMNEKFEFGYPGASSTCQEGSDVNTSMPPGDGLDELTEKKGLLVNLRVLWSDMIFTTSPGVHQDYPGDGLS